MALLQCFKKLSCYSINQNTFNIRIIYRAFLTKRKRFYKNVSVSEFDGNFEVNLDKRKLKTPLGNLLKLPNEGLASVVAMEWAKQGETLQMHNMHLTNLCNTVTDNPCQISKEALVESTLDFLCTDTICYRSCEPKELADLQKKKWDPICEWFENRFDVQVNLYTDVVNVSIPHATLEIMRKYLLDFNIWSLTGISFAAENLKSLIFTLASIHGKLDVKEAVECSRLEVLFQTSQWGSVEWSHDLENFQTMSRVSAAILFVVLNEEKICSVKKAGTTERLSSSYFGS